MLRFAIILCLAAVLSLGCGKADPGPAPAPAPEPVVPMGKGIVGSWRAVDKGTVIDFVVRADKKFSLHSKFPAGIVTWDGTWKTSAGSKDEPARMVVKIETMKTMNPDGTPAAEQFEGAGSVIIWSMDWKSGNEVVLMQKGGIDEKGRKITEKESTREVLRFRRVAK